MRATERGHRPPEVIQTSSLDCGPAALAALLRGLGCAASYEVLRDLCATDVDGTSINAVEQVARAAGAEVEQIVVPAEHVIAFPEEYLPAVAVTVLPDGFTHFVVLWRRVRGRIVVMDPGTGRRSVRLAALRNELYRHDQVVPLTGWRQWAGGDVFLAGLDARMRALGVHRSERQQLMARALDDQGIASLAGLDAAVRDREYAPPGHPMPPLPSAVATLTAQWALGGDSYSCVPASGDDASVILRGAVLVRAKGWSPGAAQRHLAERLSVPEQGPWELLLSLFPRPRRMVAGLVATALVVAGFAVAVDVGLPTLLPPAPGRNQRWLMLVLLAATALAMTNLVARSLQCGRSIDLAIRARWWSAVAKLPDGFVSSRPTSDLIERGHLLHRVRELPTLAARAAENFGVVLGGVGVLAVLAPRTWLWLTILLLAAVVGPALVARRAAETDLRVRTLAGGLSRFSYDAVLGAEAVQASKAGPALTGDHERSLTAWFAAQLQMIWVTAITSGVVGVLTTVGGTGCLVSANAGTSRELLIAVLVVTVAAAGGLLSDTLRTIPMTRSVLARAAGPLRAATCGSHHERPAAPVSIACRGVSVHRGTTVQLDDVTVDIAAGTHVAVIGDSGAGKSSLLAVLLGWTVPSRGRVLLSGSDPVPGQVVGGVAWSAPETRLWNDTIATNVAYGADPSAASIAERLRSAGAASLEAAVDARGAHLEAALGALGSGRGRAIGDGGATLSDGEAQRVRFARALGRPNAPLIVLDEPFRGVEREVRQQLMKEARLRWRGSTLVCALHDICDTRNFDQVLVLEAGRLVEHGAPATLAAAASSRYAALLAANEASAYRGWRELALGRVG